MTSPPNKKLKWLPENKGEQLVGPGLHVSCFFISKYLALLILKGNFLLKPSACRRQCGCIVSLFFRCSHVFIKICILSRAMLKREG